MENGKKTILVTGGAGYVGSVLVPKLLAAGHTVRVLDWFLYGDVFGVEDGNPRLVRIKGDLRDRQCVRTSLNGADAVIHLACISNDPSYELDPELGKTVNYDATKSLIDLSAEMGIRRFVYASSSSVYGLKAEKDVTEDLRLEPLTDYSKYKALCEGYLTEKSAESGMPACILRPATICGVSPRMRFDLTVNILTIQALVNKVITVFGGSQKRPSLHIEDMTDLYVKTMEYPEKTISGKIMNVGYENYTVLETAGLVKEILGDPEIRIEVRETNDNRSYHINSDLIRRKLGFIPRHTVGDAVRDIRRAYEKGYFPEALTDAKYYNVRKMKEAGGKFIG